MKGVAVPRQVYLFVRLAGPLVHAASGAAPFVRAKARTA